MFGKDGEHQALVTQLTGIGLNVGCGALFRSYSASTGPKEQLVQHPVQLLYRIIKYFYYHVFFFIRCMNTAFHTVWKHVPFGEVQLEDQAHGQRVLD